MREQMTIGAVARKSGCPVRTLRFYEERGLILPLGRTAKGYRLYGPEALGDLAFLKAGKRLGLALDQIGELLRIRSSGRCPCSRTRELLEGRLAEVEGALQELGELREFSSAACGGDFRDREGLKRQWEGIALAITAPGCPRRVRR